MELKAAMVYALGLFELAEEEKSVPEYREELTATCEVFEHEPEFMEILKNPGITRPEKKKMVHGVFDGRVRDHIVSFLCLLIDHGRIRDLDLIRKEYLKLEDRAEGLAEGTIYSVVPLSEEQIRKFEEETGHLLSRKVELDNKLDPKLLGGIRIVVDGRIIDASVASRLEELTRRIKQS
ncbi:MAG: F0F1 ATP synthase subunit delta [Anaerovoracaceae bacterium]|jgi:F-type H+-transporting ATPase subunit delta